MPHGLVRYWPALIGVLLAVGVGSASAQTRIVTGKVTDSLTSDPVTSGQVSIQGTTIGSTIKDDGTFTIAVPPRDVTLTIRSIGFKRQDVVVPVGQSSVQTALARDYFQLEAIVVTGHATGVERRNLANAVETVEANDLSRTPTSSVDAALQGKLAGANIASNGAGPGGGMVVQLRGVSSILGSYTPLYVVDGVVVSDVAIAPGMDVITKSSGGSTIAGSIEMPTNRIADLNPNDIENVQVLEGASASAIYGSKASNGVILITTKRGRVGAPQFSITQRVGVSSMLKKVGLRQFQTLADATAAYGPNAATYWQPGVFYDHEDELYGQHPLSYETSGNVSGGTENTRYFASGTVKRDGGIMVGTWANKQSMRLNVDQDIGARVGMGFSTQIIHNSTSRGIVGNDNSGASPADAISHTPSFFNVQQNPDGTWPTNPFVGSNPLATVNELKTDEDVWRSILAGNAHLDLLRGAQHTIRLLANGGADFFSQGDFIYSPPDLQYEIGTGLPGTVVNSQSSNLNLNLNLNAVHTYKSTGGGFSATTSVGTQYETRRLSQVRDATKNLIGTIASVQQGTVFRVEQNREYVKDAGAFAQEELLIHDRLLLTGGVRADHSSNNGDPNKLFFYPKAAASYRLNIKSGLVDELKLRAAYGQSGNEPLYGQKFTPFSGVNIVGVPATIVGNASGAAIAAAQNIVPERQAELEGGIDAQVFGSRASVEFTVYQKRISDLLLQRSLVPSDGFTQENLNGGVMRTRGLESALSVVPVRNAALQWTARGTLSFSRCVITALPVPTFRLGSLVAGNGQIEQGASCTQVVGNDTLGTLPGDASLGAIGTPIVRKIGDRNPDYLAGLSNDISYHGMRLYFLFDYRHGGVLGDGSTRHFEVSQNNAGYCESQVNGECIGAYRHRLFYTNLATRAYVRSTTFLKLREATLTVDLPRRLTQRVWSGARFIRLSLSGRDLMLITSWLGYDPEINQTATSVGPAADLAPYPPSRSFWFSLDVGF